mmetsp:Transcript_30025/g.62774  ORF Transcript_30025/g.62774 Transcript_30025/m.62774 type:complete len:160 (-) Transcript_30025:323-802(-)
MWRLDSDRDGNRDDGSNDYDGNKDGDEREDETNDVPKTVFWHLLRSTPSSYGVDGHAPAACVLGRAGPCPTPDVPSQSPDMAPFRYLHRPSSDDAPTLAVSPHTSSPRHRPSSQNPRLATCVSLLAPSSSPIRCCVGTRPIDMISLPPSIRRGCLRGSR